MFGLTTASAHAILALSCLEQTEERWVLARDLAACIGAPLPYLSKILNRLVGGGIVEAKRGYRGGFRLARPADRLTVAEIVAAVEGPDFLTGCMLGLTTCSDERACPLHGFWKQERKRIAEQLERLDLRAVSAFEQQAGRGFIRCSVDPAAVLEKEKAP